MLRTFIVLGVLGLMLLPAVVLAQPQAEDIELTIGPVGISNKELNNAQLGAQAGLGYFVTQNAEIGVRQTMIYIDADHDDNGDKTGFGSLWGGITRATLDWHLDFDQLQPFVGGSLGYKYGSSFSDSWLAGVEAGLKVYFHRNSFLYGIAEYQFDLQGSFPDGNFIYSVGLGVNW